MWLFWCVQNAIHLTVCQWMGLAGQRIYWVKWNNFLKSKIFSGASSAGKYKGIARALGEGLGEMGACTEERSLRCSMCLCALLCKSASLHAVGSVWGWVGPSVSHYSSSVLSLLQFLFLLLALACGVNTGLLKVHWTQCPISDDKIGPHWKKFLQVQVLFSPAFHL